MIFLYIIIGLLVGLLVGWLIARSQFLGKSRMDEESRVQERFALEGELKLVKLSLDERTNELNDLRQQIKEFREEISLKDQQLIREKTTNEHLTEKLNGQKEELESVVKRLNTEFENIANKIFEIKSEKLVELNKTNLKTILDPLGKNISEFKSKVEEVYDKESKERFSLGEKVKELALLNQAISQEARNLTKALKGEAKTQGRFGEVILERILEMSGLTKGREYFMEHQLTDEAGDALRSDKGGKKMRPDAVIVYPDNRSVIIDSKVSLNAYTRAVESDDPDVQNKEYADHVAAIKTHIRSLSEKGYDDYSKALDFVMMFIPNEAAYLAALQYDPDLWIYAYDKRILLLSPTNLITSLKLIADLWKREYQNRHALDIAERGAKLYDKFVGFVENLNGVGEYLNKAQGKYEDAKKQLSEGNDNLVRQAQKLKDLGLKTKKQLPDSLLESSETDS